MGRGVYLLSEKLQCLPLPSFCTEMQQSCPEFRKIPPIKLLQGEHAAGEVSPPSCPKYRIAPGHGTHLGLRAGSHDLMEFAMCA